MSVNIEKYPESALEQFGDNSIFLLISYHYGVQTAIDLHFTIDDQEMLLGILYLMTNEFLTRVNSCEELTDLSKRDISQLIYFGPMSHLLDD